MTCSHISSCELWVQFALNPALDVWKIHYCDDDYERCARLQNSMRGKAVPLTLLPNGKTLILDRSSEEIGVAALFNAIEKGRTHMVRSLLKVGANANGVNLEGITPLMLAASKGQDATIELLLDKGADINHRSSSGQSALQMAQANGQTETVKLLLKRGATA